MCLARNYTTHWHTRPERTKWFGFDRQSAKRPCTSVQHGATETVCTYWNAFVCSAVVGRVCQCKISAKYGCSVTTTLEVKGQCFFCGLGETTVLHPQSGWNNISSLGEKTLLYQQSGWNNSYISSLGEKTVLYPQSRWKKSVISTVYVKEQCYIRNLHICEVQFCKPKAEKLS